MHYGRPWPRLPLGSSKTSYQNDALAVVYVALSRVWRLKSLRSIGLNTDIRQIMESGPPNSLPAHFRNLFNEKEEQTALDAEAAMEALGSASSR